ncbi:hypothetical protein RFI_32957, partial [Reticulomyxa filosa]
MTHSQAAASNHKPSLNMHRFGVCSDSKVSSLSWAGTQKGIPIKTYALIEDTELSGTKEQYIKVTDNILSTRSGTTSRAGNHYIFDKAFGPSADLKDAILQINGPTVAMALDGYSVGELFRCTSALTILLNITAVEFYGTNVTKIRAYDLLNDANINAISNDQKKGHSSINPSKLSKRNIDNIADLENALVDIRKAAHSQLQVQTTGHSPPSGHTIFQLSICQTFVNNDHEVAQMKSNIFIVNLVGETLDNLTRHHKGFQNQIYIHNEILQSLESACVSSGLKQFRTIFKNLNKSKTNYRNQSGCGEWRKALLSCVARSSNISLMFVINPTVRVASSTDEILQFAAEISHIKVLPKELNIVLTGPPEKEQLQRPTDESNGEKNTSTNNNENNFNEATHSAEHTKSNELTPPHTHFTIQHDKPQTQPTNGSPQPSHCIPSSSLKEAQQSNDDHRTSISPKTRKVDVTVTSKKQQQSASSLLSSAVLDTALSPSLAIKKVHHHLVHDHVGEREKNVTPPLDSYDYDTNRTWSNLNQAPAKAIIQHSTNTRSIGNDMKCNDEQPDIDPDAVHLYRNNKTEKKDARHKTSKSSPKISSTMHSNGHAQGADNALTNGSVRRSLFVEPPRTIPNDNIHHNEPRKLFDNYNSNHMADPHDIENVFSIGGHFFQSTDPNTNIIADQPPNTEHTHNTESINHDNSDISFERDELFTVMPIHSPDPPQQATDIPSRKANSFECPVHGCSSVLKTEAGLHIHVNTHMSDEAGARVPQSYFQAFGRIICHRCRQILPSTVAWDNMHKKCHEDMVIQKRAFRNHRSRSHQSAEQKYEDESSNWQPPSMEEIINKPAKIIGRVPKNARSSIASTTAWILREVATNNDDAAWTKWLLFTRLILWDPGRGGSRHANATTKAIISRIKLWKENNLLKLWKDFCEHSNAIIAANEARELNPSKQAKTNASHAKAIKLTALGELSKAFKALTPSQPIKYDENTIQQLQQKHPPEAPPIELMHSLESDDVIHTLAPIPAHDPISVDELIAYTRKLGRTSAGGVDLFAAQHLIDLVPFEYESGTLSNWAKVTTLIINGMVCQSAAPIAYGARLIGIAKPDGSPRPIAIGSLLRRSAGAILMKRHAEKIKRIVGPNQFGINVKAGIELFIHGFKAVLQHIRPIKDAAAVKVDFKNAFNSCKRSRVIEL